MSDMEKVIEKALQYVPMVDASQTRIREIQAQKIAQALTASGYGGFEVVRLEWMHLPTIKVWQSETGLGMYEVVEVHGTFEARFHNEALIRPHNRVDLGIHRTDEAAKAACEADHRERVSKLVVGVDVSELVEAVEFAIRFAEGIAKFRCVGDEYVASDVARRLRAALAARSIHKGEE